MPFGQVLPQSCRSLAATLSQLHIAVLPQCSAVWSQLQQRCRHADASGVARQGFGTQPASQDGCMPRQQLHQAHQQPCSSHAAPDSCHAVESGLASQQQQQLPSHARLLWHSCRSHQTCQPVISFVQQTAPFSTAARLHQSAAAPDPTAAAASYHPSQHQPPTPQTPQPAAAAARVLDGRAVAADWSAQLQQEVPTLRSILGRPPGLAVVLVGSRPDSVLYVTRKEEACQRVGINCRITRLPESVSQAQLQEAVAAVAADQSIDGVLVQLPLPRHLDEESVMEALDPRKDVDGFHPINMGRMLMRGRARRFVPATPLGVVELLSRSAVSLAGKTAVVLGDSNIVGTPLAALLRDEGAALVTTCHRVSIQDWFEEQAAGRTQRVPSDVCLPRLPGPGPAAAAATHFSSSHSSTTATGFQASQLPAICRTADILVVAVGSPELVRQSWVKPGAVVVDVGINVVPVHGHKQHDVSSSSSSSSASMGAAVEQQQGTGQPPDAAGDNACSSSSSSTAGSDRFNGSGGCGQQRQQQQHRQPTSSFQLAQGSMSETEPALQQTGSVDGVCCQADATGSAASCGSMSSMCGSGSYRVVGDVAAEEVAAVASVLTPVPGGVGPMTIAAVLHNTLQAARYTAGLLPW